MLFQVRREAYNAYKRFTTGDKSYGIKPPKRARVSVFEKCINFYLIMEY